MTKFLRRPLWFVICVALGIVVLAAIGLGALGAALIGDPWGARFAKLVAVGGGMAIAGLVVMRSVLPPHEPKG